MIKQLTFLFLLLFSCFTSSAFAEDFIVPQNRSRLISTSAEIGEAMIANPKIADIHVHGPHRLSVIGVGRGDTTLRILDTKGNVIKSVPISVTYDLPAIRKAMREFLPSERGVGVELINTNIALVGEVSNALAVDRALEIASQFVEQITGPGAAEGPRGTSDAQKGQAVINLLQVTSGQQVMLRVRVGEIRRSALKRLGVNLQGFSQNGSFGLSGATGSGIDAIAGSTNTTGLGEFEVSSEKSFGILGGILNRGGMGVGVTLEALESDGLLKILAEPNLVALSGEKAEFLAGGEIPIPIPQSGGGGNNVVTIDYKPFGVSVSFVPYVLSENRIRMSVLPEVSEISNANGVQLQGYTVPSLTTRRAKTTVELAPGESFMIAGLIRDDMTTTLRQLPGIKEIPVLGALFRSTEFEKNETELVIAVTPYIVDPLKSGDVRLPTDDFRPASTMESFFYGALSSIAHGERKTSQTPSLEGPVGFMVE
jgi:pilus assembly protein CpaC